MLFVPHLDPLLPLFSGQLVLLHNSTESKDDHLHVGTFSDVSTHRHIKFNFIHTESVTVKIVFVFGKRAQKASSIREGTGRLILGDQEERLKEEKVRQGRVKD